MTGDVDEEVGGDNVENALDWGDGVAYWDHHCENAGSSALDKDEWGFNCEPSAITSAGTSGKVGDFRIREEQRELQGPKSKSGGTEIVMSPKIEFTKWECQDAGWKAWEAPDTTLEAEAHRQLACSAYTRVHPRCIRSWATKDGWCHSPYGQSEICNLSLMMVGRRGIR
jgi:hypothetical protein